MNLLAWLFLIAPYTLAAPIDFNARYEDCTKAAHTDEDSAACLVRFAPLLETALGERVRELVATLEANAGNRPKAKMLEDAHAKWIPSRDADCALQAAVTMDDPRDAADAAKLCVFQANVPRLRQYDRFLGFLKD